MSLIKIDKKIDVSSAKISFKTKTKKSAKVKKRVELKKLDLNVIVKKVVGSIPIQAKITDVNKQSIESRAASVVRGATPSVAAPLMKKATDSDAMKLEVKDWNDILYHDISGVCTNAKRYVNSIISGTVNTDGWVKVSDGWKFRINDKFITGWKEIHGKWYFFKSNELMHTGFLTYKGNIYYLLPNEGYMVMGWKNIDDSWYYFKERRLLNDDYGYMYTNRWIKHKNEWYYVGVDGKMVVSKLIYYKRRKYYLDSDGAMAVNRIVYDNKSGNTFRVYDDGICWEKKGDEVSIQLIDEDRFVSIVDRESNTTYYGGDQGWFEWEDDERKNKLSRSGGCGVVAAANIVAHLAKNNIKYANLYTYADYSKENYVEHMKIMYEYIDPKHLLDIPLGVWPLSHIESGIEKYANSRGISLEAVWSSEEFDKDNVTKYIREGLSSDSPVAMLYGFSNQKVKLHHPNPDLPEDQVYDKHWVTITQMTINESTGKVRLKTSSWGGYAEVYLDDFLENEKVYQGVLYFK